jgi:prepilin-type N-terminal cleavage/methylation domain-containing protein
MHLSRSGFTFVELVISLLVVGIILGLVIKGRSMIDTANIRSDVNKITKVSSAVAVFIMADNGISSNFPVSAVMPCTSSFPLGVVSDITEDDTIWDKQSLKSCKGYLNGVGAGESTPTYSNISDASIFGSGYFSFKFNCFAEEMLDDKHNDTGRFRGGTSSSAVYRIRPNDDCNQHSNVSSPTQPYFMTLW